MSIVAPELRRGGADGYHNSPVRSSEAAARQQRSGTNFRFFSGNTPSSGPPTRDNV